MGEMASTTREINHCNGNYRRQQKRALLLHYGGPEVDEIFDTIQNVVENKDYKEAVEKLTAHFSPQVNQSGP